MEITAIEPRRKRLSQLYLDGEPAVKVDTETLLKARWKVGMEISDEELHGLLQESETRRAKEKALYLLEYRSHSKKELADKISRTTSREAAEAAVETGFSDQSHFTNYFTAYTGLTPGAYRALFREERERG